MATKDQFESPDYYLIDDLLTEEQQRTLHQWYVDTGVIEEEE